MDMYNKALALDPGNAKLYVNRSDIYLTVLTHILRAQAYRYLGRLGESIEDLGRAISL